MENIPVKTQTREEFVDITQKVRDLLQQNEWKNGIIYLHCQHTTAGLTINESADPSVVRDILTHLRKTVPHKGDYKHMEGNSDAHIKSSLMGPGLSILVQNGSPVLGTWQGIFFTEFDGPRSRRVSVVWISE